MMSHPERIWLREHPNRAGGLHRPPAWLPIAHPDRESERDVEYVRADLYEALRESYRAKLWGEDAA